MTVATFETGKTYQMTFIGDSNLRPEFVCVKRTEKSATFKAVKTGEMISKKIRVHGDREYVLYGSYSMAPVIGANHLVR